MSSLTDNPEMGQETGGSEIEILLGQALADCNDCLNRGDFAGALQLLDHAVDLAPMSPEILAHRGRLLLWLKKFDLAQADFGEALKTDPRCAANNSGLARCHFETGAYDQAKIFATRAREADPTNSEAGDILSALGKLAGPGDGAKPFKKVQYQPGPKQVSIKDAVINANASGESISTAGNFENPAPDPCSSANIELDSGLTLEIGEHSYIHDDKIRNPSGALTGITIGKFCCIATGLTIVGYDHHTEWATTYPFLDDGHRANWPGTNGIAYPQSKKFGSNKSRGDIEIGSDVWIGCDVKLFKGITIGEGAVIGACSLVNKSIEPYTIVAGIPARPIRKRFSEAEIVLLQRIKWWDWPASLINRYLPLLCSSNIGELERNLEADTDFHNFKQGRVVTAPAVIMAPRTERPDVGPAEPAAHSPQSRQVKSIVMQASTNSPAASDQAPVTEAKIRQLAKFVGDDWKQRPYYDEAESHMDMQWRETVWPFIQAADFSYVLDLAAGHGRNSEKLKQYADKIHIVDINSENIEYCKKRFAGDTRFLFNQNDGCSLSFIPPDSLSLVYCFDAMVHFDSDVVRAYLREFARVLRPNGLGFCHHSNYTQNPGGDMHHNPGWRNFMSQALFAHYCSKEGLLVVKSRVINWELPGSDCITLFRRNPQP